MKGKVLTLLGFAATAIGFAATFAQNWIDEKQTEEMIDEKIKAALAENEEVEES